MAVDVSCGSIRGVPRISRNGGRNGFTAPGRWISGALLHSLPTILCLFPVLFLCSCSEYVSVDSEIGSVALTSKQDAGGGGVSNEAIKKSSLPGTHTGPLIGQQVALAVPPYVENVPSSNATVRLRGEWTNMSLDPSEYRQDICISLINVATRPAKSRPHGSPTSTSPATAHPDWSISSYARRLTANHESEVSLGADRTLSTSSATIPRNVDKPTGLTLELDPDEFPVDCEKSFKLATPRPLESITTTVVCGPDKELSDVENLVFHLPVELLEFIYLNFDVLGELKPLEKFGYSSPRARFAVRSASVLLTHISETAPTPTELDTTGLNGEDGISSAKIEAQSHPERVAKQRPADIRLCFRASAQDTPIEAGRAVFHPAPSPKIPSEIPHTSIKVRKFINPGWEWESLVEGTHLTKYNFLSLKYLGPDSTNPCSGFEDRNTYMSVKAGRIKHDGDSGERAMFRFGEDFRISSGHSHSRSGQPPVFNVCLYSDDNEERGTKLEVVDFVIDPKDASLFVAFVIFVLLCILICGITISCYAFKHRRLRKKLRRLRLVQQRDDIERRLMIELGIGDMDDGTEGPVENE